MHILRCSACTFRFATLFSLLWINTFAFNWIFRTSNWAVAIWSLLKQFFDCIWGVSTFWVHFAVMDSKEKKTKKLKWVSIYQIKWFASANHTNYFCVLFSIVSRYPRPIEPAKSNERKIQEPGMSKAKKSAPKLKQDQVLRTVEVYSRESHTVVTSTTVEKHCVTYFAATKSTNRK